MPETQTWTCGCGATRLAIRTGDGSRALCYCRDCRAFTRHFGRTDMLDAAGGSDLYLVAPHHIRILEGEANLAAIRLTGKGPVRWYAACCGTPMANTMPTRAIPYVTTLVGGFEDPDALGPIQAQAYRKQALGYVEREGGSFLLVALAVLRRAAGAGITGKWRRNPFFDDAGEPRVRWKRLGGEERERAYDEAETL